MSRRSPRVLFYVQHLLGIGHLKRAALLAKAWQAAGLEVAVVAGGEAVAGVDFGAVPVHPLPPVRAADAQFSALVGTDGQPIDEAFKQRRRERLLALYRQLQPDILVIESYPFGRRQLRWELRPLLDAAHRTTPRPLVCASVRDILQQRKPARVTESETLVESYFDWILVHGDPAFIPLEISLPECHRFASKLCYTGYVTDPAVLPHQPTEGAEVLVSAGGGAVGFQLMRAALAARSGSPLADRRWRFLVGPNLPLDQRRWLEAQAGERVIVEPVRPDFVQLLSQCALSISQGGYNTVMDLLGVGCPAVLVPFEGDGESEQLTRCQRLQEQGIGAMVRERELSGETLGAAIVQAVQGSTTGLHLARDGGARSARQLRQLWEAHGD